MKTKILNIVVFCLTLFVSMAQDQEKTVFEKYDSSNRLIERWGNENMWDSGMNFREFYYYDYSDNIVRTLYYAFDDENTDCIIPEKDKLNYTETIFEYSGDVLTLEKKYMPIFNNEDKITGHKLYYVYDHLKQKEVDPFEEK